MAYTKPPVVLDERFNKPLVCMYVCVAVTTATIKVTMPLDPPLTFKQKRQQTDIVAQSLQNCTHDCQMHSPLFP